MHQNGTRRQNRKVGQSNFIFVAFLRVQRMYVVFLALALHFRAFCMASCTFRGRRIFLNASHDGHKKNFNEKGNSDIIMQCNVMNNAINFFWWGFKNEFYDVFGLALDTIWWQLCWCLFHLKSEERLFKFLLW